MGESVPFLCISVSLRFDFEGDFYSYNDSKTKIFARSLYGHFYSFYEYVCPLVHGFVSAGFAGNERIFFGIAIFGEPYLNFILCVLCNFHDFAWPFKR